MPVAKKAAVAAKKAPLKAVAKKAAPVKKATAKKAAGKSLDLGDMYACEVCGLTVVIDEECGCTEVHEIMCCETPMKQKAKKVRTAK